MKDDIVNREKATEMNLTFDFTKIKTFLGRIEFVYFLDLLLGQKMKKTKKSPQENLLKGKHFFRVNYKLVRNNLLTCSK